MEFLKQILGDELYTQFESKIKEYNGNEANKDKQIKLVNSANGEYISKSEYDALNETLKGKQTELDTANTLISDLKKGTKGDEALKERLIILLTRGVYMATVKKHISKNGKITYYIRCYDGYDRNGKQIERSTTWKPSDNMTSKQIEKELKRQVILFEESVKNGSCFDSNTRFADYAEKWLENNKPPQLAPKTYERYKSLLKNINTAIGHIKLVKLQSHHLQEFYEVQGLSGAVYEIRAAEDIITPDGTLRTSKGEVLDTVTTDETGFAKSKELYLGKYEIKEITAPYGMVLNKDSSMVKQWKCLKAVQKHMKKVLLLLTIAQGKQ